MRSISCQQKFSLVMQWRAARWSLLKDEIMEGQRLLLVESRQRCCKTVMHCEICGCIQRLFKKESGACPHPGEDDSGPTFGFVEKTSDKDRLFGRSLQFVDGSGVVGDDRELGHQHASVLCFAPSCPWRRGIWEPGLEVKGFATHLSVSRANLKAARRWK
jgi:hypothetical protein